MSAGNTDTNLTASSYSFVPKLIEEEYQNLRSAYQLAVKRERTAPRHEKEDRIAEKEQLERDVNRARTRLDVARKAEREREVLKKVKTEQKERAKEGKGTFHLKRGELRAGRRRRSFGNVSLMQVHCMLSQAKRRIFCSRLDSRRFKPKEANEPSRRPSRRSKRRLLERRRRVDRLPRVRFRKAVVLVVVVVVEEEMGPRGSGGRSVKAVVAASFGCDVVQQDDMIMWIDLLR